MCEWRAATASTSKSPSKSLSPKAEAPRRGRTIEIDEDDSDSSSVHDPGSPTSIRRHRSPKRSKILFKEPKRKTCVHSPVFKFPWTLTGTAQAQDPRPELGFSFFLLG